MNLPNELADIVKKEAESRYSSLYNKTRHATWTGNELIAHCINSFEAGASFFFWKTKQEIKELSGVFKLPDVTLRDNAFMAGGNTDAEKDFYALGFKAGMSHSKYDILKDAGEYWKRRCQAAEELIELMSIHLNVPPGKEKFVIQNFAPVQNKWLTIKNEL